MPPSFRTAAQPVIQPADPSGNPGETGGIAGVSLQPIVENCGFVCLCVWFWWRIIRILFHRAGQEPQVVLGPRVNLSRMGREGVGFILLTKHLRLHVCKMRQFCILPKGLVGMRLHILYRTRARRSASAL